MAGGDTRIKAILELLLKGKGWKDGKKSLEATGKAADKTATKLKKADKAGAGFGRTIATYLGGAVLARFVKDSVLAFASLERRLNSLRFAMKNLGLDADRDLPKVVESLTAMEQAGGPLIQETIPAFQKFVGVLKDTGAALAATRLAADLSEAGLGNVETNAQRLSNLLQGRATEAAIAFGLELKDINGITKTQVQLLDELADLYGGFGSKVSDTETQTAKLASTWNQLKLNIGKPFAQAAKWAADALGWIVTQAKLAGNSIGTLVSAAVQGFTGVGNVIRAAFDFKKLVDQGPGAYLKTLTETAKREMQIQADILADGIKESIRIRRKGGEDQATAEAEGWEKVREVARAKEREQAFKAAQKQAEADRKQAIKDAEARAAFDENIRDEILRAELEATEDGSQARLDAELVMLERLREQALDEAKTKGADVAMVNLLFDQMEQQRRNEFADERDEAEAERARDLAERLKSIDDEARQTEIDVFAEDQAQRLEMQLEALEDERQQVLENKELTTDELLALDRLYALKKLKIEKDLVAATKVLDEQVKQNKQDMAFAIANQAIALGTALFGHSKALAAAETVLRTAMGVMSALALYPPNLPLAGLIAATGAVQLATIMGANLGGGGGGGTAGLSGGAGNVVPYNEPGQAAPGPDRRDRDQQGGSQQTTNNYNFTGTNIVDDASWRRMARKIRRAERRDQTRVAR